MENLLDMRFVRIPAGEFVIGTEAIVSTRREVPDPAPDALMDETPAHKVIASTAFQLGETELTQQTWLRVMKNRPGGRLHDGGAKTGRHCRSQPSPGSWQNGSLEELNTMDTWYRYRLPTEAEWGYAARAIKSTGKDPCFVAA